MRTSTNEDEETQKDRPQSRSESFIVVACASPRGEAILQEMIVPLALRPTQNIGHQAQSLESRRRFLVEFVDFALRRLLVLLDVHGRLCALLRVGPLGLVVIRQPSAAGLVWVDLAREGAVGLVDVFIVRGGFHAEEGVKRGIVAFAGDDFVAQAENLVVLFGPGGCEGDEADEQQGGCPKNGPHGG